MKKERLGPSLQVSGGKEYSDDSRVRCHCLIDAKLSVVLPTLFLLHQCKCQLSEKGAWYPSVIRKIALISWTS